MSEFELNTIEQFAELTQPQFERMLPDFIGWFVLVKEAQALGAVAVGFTWVDDGKPSEIHSINIEEIDTGEHYTVYGAAAIRSGK